MIFKSKILTYLSIACLALVFISAGGGKTETMVVKTKIYCDHCIECATCGGLLKHDLSFTKGIRKIEVKPEQEEIVVTYQPAKITAEEIRQEIAKRGYRADSLSALPEGYDKLDACCKKKE